MPICNIEREKRILHLLISVREPQNKISLRTNQCIKYKCHLLQEMTQKGLLDQT